jgi:hypothetical protein
MSRHRRSGGVAARVIVGLGALLVGATVAGARQERAKADPKANALMGPREGLLDQLEAGPSLPDDDELAGLPRGSHPPVLTLRRAYELALIRHRAPSPPSPGDRLAGLDPKALDALGRRYNVADFDRFRRDALARKGDAFAFRDPTEGFLDLLARLHDIAAARRLVDQEQRLLGFYQEQVEAKVGVTPLLVDQVAQLLEQDRGDLLDVIRHYRDGVDAFKVGLGLPPQAPMVIDRSPLAPMHEVFRGIDLWSRRPDRRLEELPGLIHRLPPQPDVTIGGHPLFGTIERDPTSLEPVLRLATDAAVKAHVGAAGDEARTLRIRKLVRDLSAIRHRFLLEQRRYALALRVTDQMIEEALTPVERRPDEPVPAPVPLRSLIPDVIRGSRDARSHEGRLVRSWASYQAGRLTLLRELGILPYADWDSYLSEILPPPLLKAPEAPAPAPAPKLEVEPLPPPPPDR